MTPEALVRIALAEDLPRGDYTSDAFISASLVGHGYFETRESMIVSGLSYVDEVFRQIDPDVRLTHLTSDGSQAGRGTRLVEVQGRARSLLAAERTALNFLGYLSGIATQTNAYVQRCRDYPAKILGTRKILPAFRAAAAAAIRHGGGDIYRVNLSDAMLVKDNHLAALGGFAQLSTASLSAGQLRDGKVEVDNFQQLESALRQGWSNILLDNFPPDDVRRAVELYGRKATLEASGGITLDNVAAYAATGVHYISIGALTHSVRTIDVGLELIWKQA